MLNPLVPLGSQKQSLFPVGGDNNGIGSLLSQGQLFRQQITPPSITPPSPQTDVVDLQRTSTPLQNPYGIQSMQNSNNMNDFNSMVDNIIKERLKELFGGIMSMFDV